MYEQWIFLQLASGLRATGFPFGVGGGCISSYPPAAVFLMDLPPEVRDFPSCGPAGSTGPLRAWIRPHIFRRTYECFHGLEGGASGMISASCSHFRSPGIGLRVWYWARKCTKRLK